MEVEKIEQERGLPEGVNIGLNFPAVMAWEEREGRRYVVLEGLEGFFTSLVSAGERWFFCTSEGAVAAGWRSPEWSLYPYQTVDRLLDGGGDQGSWTGVVADGMWWRPFERTIAGLSGVKRRLLKSELGDELIFEERHDGLGLVFEFRWQLSDEFGFVRKARVRNVGQTAKQVRVVDGLNGFLPSGVSLALEQQLSCLADAYKLTERTGKEPLVVHRLASGVVDAPIPMECLRATTVWVQADQAGQLFLSRKEAERYLSGEQTKAKNLVRATKGAVIWGWEGELAAGDEQGWMMVAEVNQTQSEVSALREGLRTGVDSMRTALEADLAKGRERLRSVVAAADGFQESADRDVVLYHYYNTLCNLLRGGVPEDGSQVRKKNLEASVRTHSREVATRFAEWFQTKPRQAERSEWISWARATGDPDLPRLVGEYLPLMMSRRHGDPSRPWNRFEIRLRDEDGEPVHHFEGNWRDVFQNWEALAWSYPDWLDGFIGKFLNASTADGYNPYRITATGVDWEEPEEGNPWVSIGYWGDHQLIYLLKLLELRAKLDEGGMVGDFVGDDYVFVDVPYRLKSWDDLLNDPRKSVDFDEKRDADLRAQMAEIGADGSLLRNAFGEMVRANFLEKLLIPVLTKLGNLVPDGGVWMNTRKPEWNDANNALAGWGLSVVTAGYLCRYLRFLDEQLNRAETKGTTVELMVGVADFLMRLGELFEGKRWALGEDSARGRYEWVEAAGRASEWYRTQIYQKHLGPRRQVALADLRSFLKNAEMAVSRLLKRNGRDDGLWHSYQVLEADLTRRTMNVRPLGLMLEGQVSILSSGVLSPTESLRLLQGLEKSELRSKQHPTYLLYPDRELPAFEKKNWVTAERWKELSISHDQNEAIFEKDPTGGYRFRADFVNGYELQKALSDFPKDKQEKIAQLYEETFDHRSFTGRSGSMFSYEGLGCVYWHMISKLLLAVQEVTVTSLQNEDQRASDFVAAYFAVQRGLGYRQTPEQFGAFPAEPYSHSSSHSGASQPGLTGQAKEGILSRWGELGVHFADGCLRFEPRLLWAGEFECSEEVSFTFGAIPVRYLLVNNTVTSIRVISENGEITERKDGSLTRAQTLEVIRRSRKISRIEVDIPSSLLIR